jgi:hypothetical protein
MPTDPQTVPAPPLIYPEPPKIPDEVEKLLALQVATRSISQMRTAITLVAAAVALGAAGLGYKIMDLNSTLAATRVKADSLDLRASEMVANLASSRELQKHLVEDAQAERDRARIEFAEIVRQYESATLVTLQQAIGAQQAATAADTRSRGVADAFARLQTSTVDLQTRLDGEIGRIAHRDSLSAQSVTAMNNHVFGTWTVIVDQRGPAMPAGDSHLTARALRIAGSRRVRVLVEGDSPEHPVLCGQPIDLEVGGDGRRCDLNGTTYEVAVSWAIKQGLSLIPFVSGRYPDRAAIRISRLTS